MMLDHANDNVRIIEPFHRLYASKLLHTTKAMNDVLYYVGGKYRKSFFDAGGTCSSPPPAYEKPINGYDDYRQVMIIRADRCLPYHEAARILDALEIREVVEAIVVHGRPVVGVGKVYSDYATDLQARSYAGKWVMTG